MLSKFFHQVRLFVDIVLWGISPLAYIGFIIALLALITGYGEHRRFLRRLDEFGLVAQGVVSSTSPENDWVFVNYVDETGETRYGTLDMFYYDDAQLWQTLVPDTAVTLLHLSSSTPGNDRVILAEYYAEVQAYRGYFTPELIGMLLVCWAVVIYKPYYLYFGLVDMDMLFKDGFPR